MTSADRLLALPQDVRNTLETFQHARLEFATEITNIVNQAASLELSEQLERASTVGAPAMPNASNQRRPEFVMLERGEASKYLRALSSDPVPSIRAVSLLALAEMIKRNPQIANDAISLVPTVVYWIETQTDDQLARCAPENRVSLSEFRRVATHFLRSFAVHDSQLATRLIQSGALKAFVHMLQVFQSSQKEAGLWGIHHLLQHGRDVTETIIDHGKLVESVLMCCREPAPEVSSIAISILASMCKYEPQLTQKIVDSGAIEIVASLWKDVQRATRSEPTNESTEQVDSQPTIQAVDDRILIAILAFLAQVCKHDEQILSLVSDQIAFFPLLSQLFISKQYDIHVKQNSLALLSVLSQYSKYATHIMASRDTDAILKTVGEEAFNNILTQWHALRLVKSLAQLKSESITKRIISASDQLIRPIVQNLICTDEGKRFKFVTPTVRMFALVTLQSLVSAVQRQWEQLEVILGYETISVVDGLVSRLEGSRKNNELLEVAIETMEILIGGGIQRIEPLLPLLRDGQNETVLLKCIPQLKTILSGDSKQQRLFVEQKWLAVLQEWLYKEKVSDGVQNEIKSLNSIYSVELVKFHTPGYEKELFDMVRE